MKLIKNSSGTEGAANLSKQSTHLLPTPANREYQQSRYIVAVSKYLGYEGLHYAVTDRQDDGIEYLFDFYQPEKKQLIKIFGWFDQAEYEKYLNHPSRPILILDSTELPVRRKYDAGESTNCLMVHKKVAEHIWEDPSTYLYADGKLWEHELQIPGWGWRPMMELSTREMTFKVMLAMVKKRTATESQAANHQPA